MAGSSSPRPYRSFSVCSSCSPSCRTCGSARRMKKGSSSAQALPAGVRRPEHLDVGAHNDVLCGRLGGVPDSAWHDHRDRRESEPERQIVLPQRHPHPLGGAGFGGGNDVGLDVSPLIRRGGDAHELHGHLCEDGPVVHAVDRHPRPRLCQHMEDVPLRDDHGTRGAPVHQSGTLRGRHDRWGVGTAKDALYHASVSPQRPLLPAHTPEHLGLQRHHHHLHDDAGRPRRICRWCCRSTYTARPSSTSC